jgi:type I restriction enzyme, S subunit
LSKQPDHVALDSICSINPPPSIKTSADTTVTYLPMEHIAEGGGQLQVATRRRDAIPNGLTPFQEGDVLIAKITPCFENMKGWLAQGLSSGVGFGSTELHVVRAGPKVLPRILYAHSLSPRFRRLGARFMTGSAGQQRVSADFLRAYRIWLPSLATQHRIADIDQRLEGALRSTDALIAAKREQKRGLMQQLLTGKVRFPGFTEPWRTVRLGDVAHEVSERNKGQLAEQDVCGVIKGAGLMPMRERVMGDDLTRYLVVDPHSFAYNPMRLNIGSIAFNTSHRRVLVSPDYVVFATRSAQLRPEYLNHVRASWLWERFVQRAGSGSVRTRIYFDDVAQLKLPIPTPTEQDRINAVLQNHNAELRLLNQQREALAAQRRGLMERLLSGDIALPSSDTSAA